MEPLHSACVFLPCKVTSPEVFVKLGFFGIEWVKLSERNVWNPPDFDNCAIIAICAACRKDIGDRSKAALSRDQGKIAAIFSNNNRMKQSSLFD
jgi:hypothetical protein